MLPRKIIVFISMVVLGNILAISQTSTFTSKTEEVHIFAFVTEKNEPVQGLNASDFEVWDNGVPQQIEYAGFEQVPISTVLVFDMSSSTKGKVIENLKAAGKDFLESLAPNDQASLITFSQAVKLDAPFTTDISHIKKSFDTLQPHSSEHTSLIDASYAAVILAESKAERPLIILFSDGLDTSSWMQDNAVLDSARRNNSVVYAVSAGRLPNKTFLYDLSSATGGTLFKVESTQNLGSVFLGILKEFRHRYLLTYSPQKVSKSGWHRIEVRIKHRSAKVRARPGYFSNFTP
jgi:Ca-activated chloride channel homolog